MALTIRCRPDYIDRFTELCCSRAHAIDRMPGFLGLEVLVPTDGKPDYRVVTHWKDERDYERWLGSPEYLEGHKDHYEDMARAAANGEEPPIVVAVNLYKILSV